MSDEFLYLIEYLLHWSPLVSSSRLDCETECTEVITSCLYDHEFSREEFLARELAQCSYLALHHLASLFWSESKIIWILRKYFYLIFVSLELRVYFEESWIHYTISDITTSREVEFFIVS